MPQSILAWHRRFGYPVFYTPDILVRGNVAIVADAEVMREILMSPTSTKPGIYKRSENLTGAKTMFSENGSRWMHVRKSIACAFSSSHVKRMSEVTIKHTLEFMEVLDDLHEKNKSFDIGKAMIQLTLKIICEAAFEFDMDTLDQEIFLKELEIVLLENRNGIIPLRWRFGYLFPKVRRQHVGTKRLAALGRKILEIYNTLQNPIRGTVLDCIVRDESYENDEERIADIIVLLVAGHDTTAYSLAWLFLELAKNKEQQRKLRSELQSSSNLQERLQIPFLHYVIKEGMRLHPVAPVGGIRMCNQDFHYVVEDIAGTKVQHKIPKDTIVVLSSLCILRGHSYFDEPDSFLPDRWRDPSEQASRAFFPFIVGKRSCIGKPLAIAEIQTILSTFILKYSWSVEEMGSDTFFMTYKPIGAMLKARKI
jgi:cytochrome P450